MKSNVFNLCSVTTRTQNPTTVPHHPLYPTGHHSSPLDSSPLLTTPHHSSLLPTTPHHPPSPNHSPLLLTLTNSPYPSALLPTTKRTEPDQHIREPSPLYVYEPLKDLPVTQNIIIDPYLQKLILGQNRPKVGIWRWQLARGKLRTCNFVDSFFHVQYFTTKYPSKRPLFHIFKSFNYVKLFLLLILPCT